MRTGKKQNHYIQPLHWCVDVSSCFQEENDLHRKECPAQGSGSDCPALAKRDVFSPPPVSNRLTGDSQVSKAAVGRRGSAVCSWPVTSACKCCEPPRDREGKTGQTREKRLAHLLALH